MNVFGLVGPQQFQLAQLSALGIFVVDERSEERTFDRRPTLSSIVICQQRT